MIIPVAFRVSKKTNFEDFDPTITIKDIVATPPVDMRVRVQLFDTETRRGLGFSARVLVDPEEDPYHNLMTVIEMKNGVLANHVEYLRQLRDAINDELKILGEDQ